MIELKWTCPDGKALLVRKWEAQGAGNRALLVVHGMAEHSLRYDEFAQFIARHGTTVYAYDQRGHGFSLEESEVPGYVADRGGWSKLLNDIDFVAKTISKEEGQVCFLGHSMGAILLLNYMQLFNQFGDRYILSALTYKQNLLSSLGRGLSFVQSKTRGQLSKGRVQHFLSFENYNQAFKPTRTEADWISRDPEVVDQYVNDPMCGAVFTSQFFYDLAGGVKSIYKPEHLAKLPKDKRVLMIAGGDDPVAGGAEKFKATVNRIMKEINEVHDKLYPSGRHEMLNELNRREVFEDILIFLNQ